MYTLSIYTEDVVMYTLRMYTVYIEDWTYVYFE